MVPIVFKSGKSFKKLAAYLLHDAEKAKTAERVAWTHALNMAADTPELAIDEMFWTYRAADELKRQAGIRAGGRPLEHPVRHYSINWHPSENPSREHMIETAESFLARIGAKDHQAFIVCHNDKPHPHIHIMLNAVHPETGRALDDAFEKVRVQEWAKAYELEHGRVFCEERLKPAEERTPSPTRATWEQLRGYENEDDRREQSRPEKDFDYFSRHADKPAAREWQFLKSQQRGEREEFFADGKEAYRKARNAAYREVRTEFRDEWKEFYARKREGMDSQRLAAWKAEIVADQRLELDERRQEACDVLRERRDEEYSILLARQQEDRQKLRDRQAEGLRSYDMLDRSYPELPINPLESEDARLPNGPIDELFRSAAREIGERDGDSGSEARQETPATPVNDHGQQERPGIGLLGLGGLGALATIGERLFDGFLGGHATPPPRRAETEERQPDSRRTDALRTAASQADGEARDAEARRLEAWWAERRQRSRERD